MSELNIENTVCAESLEVLSGIFRKDYRENPLCAMHVESYYAFAR